MLDSFNFILKVAFTNFNFFLFKIEISIDMCFLIVERLQERDVEAKREFSELHVRHNEVGSLIFIVFNFIF